MYHHFDDKADLYGHDTRVELEQFLVGTGQAMDTWLIAHPPDAEAPPELVHVLADGPRGPVARVVVRAHRGRAR